MKNPVTVNLSQVQSDRSLFQGRSVAVHLHLFYLEKADEMAGFLENVPVQFDLFISIPENKESDDTGLKALFSQNGMIKEIRIEHTPNRGRDIAPMICTFGRELMEHDFILHLHTKKSPHDSTFTGWSSFILEHLVSTKENVEKILTQLSGRIGIAAPPVYISYTDMGGWHKRRNRNLSQQLLDRAGYKTDLRKSCPNVHYPQGSMFWARTDYLAPLFNLGLSYDDFQKEPIKTDGTVAHAIERLFFIWGEGTDYSAAYIFNNAWQTDLINYMNLLGRKYHKHLRNGQKLIWISAALLVAVISVCIGLF